MKTIRHHKTSRREPPVKVAELRLRLAEAEATLRAIRSGDVDTLVVPGKQGPQVFTLEGAEHAYRVLIESMHEGALTLTAGLMILFSNKCFARMVHCPLEKVIGSSFQRFLSEEDRAILQSLVKGKSKAGSIIQAVLNVGHGSQLDVQISIRALDREGANGPTIGIVVTDMSEVRRNEDMLRALSHRLIQAQEAERGKVAFELHSNITQLLCGILVRCQTLANKLSEREGPAKSEAVKLRKLLGETAEEVERISRNLRPSVLTELGLAAVLRDTCMGFAERTGASCKMTCVALASRLPADIELTLFRILQEALLNVESHASARHVVVLLSKPGGLVRLTIKDDGVGFDSDQHPFGRKGKAGLGLLGMRERAAYVGGTVSVQSARRVGTKIEIRIPLPPAGKADSQKEL